MVVTLTPVCSVDLAVGHALLQQPDDRPAVGEGLQFRRRAEVAEEVTALVDAPEREHGLEQRAFRGGFLAGGDARWFFTVDPMY